MWWKGVTSCTSVCGDDVRSLQTVCYTVQHACPSHKDSTQTLANPLEWAQAQALVSRSPRQAAVSTRVPRIPGGRCPFRPPLLSQNLATEYFTV
jgi:hypothetical protein